MPKKINILVWRACKERLGVKTLLAKMNAFSGNSNCDVCNSFEESVKHIFIDCPLAKELWCRIIFWWNLKEKNVDSIDEVLDWLAEEGRNATEKKTLGVIGAALIASIWQHRNEATFLEKRRSVDALFSQIQRESCLWIDSRASRINIDRRLWVSSPRLALTVM